MVKLGVRKLNNDYNPNKEPDSSNTLPDNQAPLNENNTHIPRPKETASSQSDFLPLDYPDARAKKKRKFHPVRAFFMALIALFLLALVVTFSYKLLSGYSFSITSDNGSISLRISPDGQNTDTDDSNQPSTGDQPAGPPPDSEGPPQSGNGDKPDDDYNSEQTPSITSSPTADGTTLNISTAHMKELTLQNIYKKVAPSVVTITCQTTGSSSSGGTGIIMSSGGYIITNYHVIESSSSITVILNDGTEYSASITGTDETSDLAVLKIEASGLQPAEFGNSNDLEVGDTVMAIGNPLGAELKGTFTNGIISAINRDISLNGKSMTLIQTNAALNSGNSGGPLINIYGQVIGINTMKMSSYYSTIEGLGFAIPVSIAKPIVDELIEKGYVSGRPAIGITCSDISPAASAYYGLPQGAYVAYVNPASDAYTNGITKGDIITQLNGSDVTSTDDLNSVKNSCAAGDTISITFYRDGVYYSVEVILMDEADADSGLDSSFP